MQKNREFRFWTHLANTVASMVFGGAFAFQLHILADAAQTSATLREEPALQKKINFTSAAGTKRTPNPAGWEAYDGSVYTQAKGYGWVSKPSGFYTSDEGQDTTIQLPNGVTTSARELGRPELASWHGAHQENQPLVFRIDLPNGWYRVRCASVADKPLPVIDQRNFKCRANDSIFAGPQSGPPLKVGGRDLVEGSNVVEVTDG